MALGNVQEIRTELILFSLFHTLTEVFEAPLKVIAVIP